MKIKLYEEFISDSKQLRRELKINDILFIKGVKVKLPFDMEGEIVDITKNRLDWFPYKVKITETNGLFGYIGEIQEFKGEQLELIK